MDMLLKECRIDEKCSYIQGHSQTTQYKIIHECSSAYCEALIERGWRRFGNMFFRPVCEGCEACESIKIDVENYRFSKSERRTLRKASHFTTVMRHPTLSDAHIDLFRKYHAHMETKRGWDTQAITPKNYYMSFVHGYNDFGYEVLYFDGDRLIAVDLIDILPEGISSIYFYYDPDYERYALGRYSIYRQILYARQNNLKWIYLGYYVESCQSLAYKSQFDPYVTLQRRPSESCIPQWI